MITAGTSDIRVAEEAKIIAEEMGCEVRTAYDVGAAGIHRLFPALRPLLSAHVFVVCAGREGTLPSVVAGLVDKPVIGVPVSAGYRYMGEGAGCAGKYAPVLFGSRGSQYRCPVSLPVHLRHVSQTGEYNHETRILYRAVSAVP